MFICYVKHGDNQKKYLFDCTKLHNKISIGSRVMCNTMRGEKIGVVVSSPVAINGAAGREEILRELGAYLPLKTIIGIYVDKVKLSDIKIPKAFSDTCPITRKISECYDYCRKQRRFDREIVLNKNNVLIDGYVAYLIAKMLGLEEVEVYVR